MKNTQNAIEVDAGHFENQNSALQLKFKLASALKQPVHVKKNIKTQGYDVTVGPLNNDHTVQSIRNSLYQLTQKTSPTPSAASALQNALGLQPPPKAAPDAALPQQKVPEAMEPNARLWNLQSADIRAVIQEVARVTGKNFIIDPRVQGKISIVSAAPISKDALYKVFLSMLQVSGYSAIPSGDVIKIMPNSEARAMAPGLSAAPGLQPMEDEMLVQVIPVQYVPADQLIPTLRPLMPQWSNVSAYVPSNMLILSGHSENIKTVSDIIKAVDTPQANGIDIVPLHHALAMDVVNTLKDLVKPQASFGMRAPPSIAADDRSNAILISGSRTDRMRLRLLIANIDNRTPEAFNSHTQVVYLNYMRAEDIVPILAGIAQANFSGVVGTTLGTVTRPALDSTNPASNLANNSSGSTGFASTNSSTSSNSSASSTPGAMGATPNTSGVATQNEGSTKPNVQIIGEPNTNSVILNAPPAIIRILKNVIAQLDIKPAQLLIEALVAEVDENSVHALGIEWGTNQQTGDPSKFSPGFAIINSKTSLTDFQAQLYALVRDRKANVLSTPSVLVLDNRQAKILVGQQVSVASTTYPNNAGGSTTASPYVTYERVNVALHLYVRPQITRNNGIQLQIDQGNDTIDPASAASANPVFNVSSIVTAVQVDSGDVVVLGGLVQDSLANADVDLPFIRKLPGLGKLFQHRTRTRDKRVLMVFIKPKILTFEHDALQVSGEKYRNLREHELRNLRAEPFKKSNEETILPALRQAELPLPFSQTMQVEQARRQ